MTLTGFLLARIAEDEADWSAVDVAPFREYLHGRPIAPRILAECEAKRRIVERYDRLGEYGDLGDAHWVLKLLAQPYADHADFDPEWRP